ncbi:hypothetical protein [Streptomyces sp. NPDC002994]|uniref:hypothetical protein n=1 Tax=Streptomyces sp. NPDC002994 TaxID=3154441 RepID=UPI0033ADA55D
MERDGGLKLVHRHRLQQRRLQRPHPLAAHLFLPLLLACQAGRSHHRVGQLDHHDLIARQQTTRHR